MNIHNKKDPVKSHRCFKPTSALYARPTAHLPSSKNFKDPEVGLTCTRESQLKKIFRTGAHSQCFKLCSFQFSYNARKKSPKTSRGQSAWFRITASSVTETPKFDPAGCQRALNRATCSRAVVQRLHHQRIPRLTCLGFCTNAKRVT